MPDTHPDHLILISIPEDKATTSRSVGIQLPTDTVPYARRMEFWALPLRKPKNCYRYAVLFSIFFVTHKKQVALLVARTVTDTCKGDWERIMVEQWN